MADKKRRTFSDQSDPLNLTNPLNPTFMSQSEEEEKLLSAEEWGQKVQRYSRVNLMKLKNRENLLDLEHSN
jgi:peptide deformylase